MKTKIIIFIFLGCLFVSDVLAQESAYVLRHPLMPLNFKRISTSVDSIFHETGYISYYTRSEDKLTDTIRHSIYDGYENVVTVSVKRYDEKNRLLYYHEIPSRQLFTGKFGYSRCDFEYDEEGRMFRCVGSFINMSVNPENPSIEYTGEEIWDYALIRKTEKGYIFGYVEVELDDQGRITYVKNYPEEGVVIDALGRKSYPVKGLYRWQSNNHAHHVKGTDFPNQESRELVVYSSYEEESFAEFEGKKYRVNDSYYTYTDSSFTVFGCYKTGTGDGLTQWNKITYVFNENGDDKRSISWISDDGINWRLYSDVETRYGYIVKTSTYDGEVSNYSVSETGKTVYAHSGAVYVVTENIANVQIFDISGRLVKQQAVSQGENRINLPSGGLFFVKVGNESFKVLVR